MLDESRFREVMGHFTTGVTVVTARDEKGSPVGLTVSALTSVSLQPTLLLICVHRDAESHDQIIQGGVFAVNILADQQGPLAMDFAQLPLGERFQDLEVGEAPLGSPLLPETLAWLECEVREVWPAGDHSVILGEVTACEAHPGEPLLFYRSQLKGMAP
jgi:flavin reductase (DIM6/NTAB) family NADH-FMN oxidoreductase RutF